MATAAILPVFRRPFGSPRERLTSILVSSRAAILGGQAFRTPYQVLDISPDERDPKTIEEAALRCSCEVRAYQLTSESECALRLNEIAQALIALLDPVGCRQDDRDLGKSASRAEPKRRRAVRRNAPSAPRGKDAPPAPVKGTVVLHLGAGRTCDVKLVYRR